MEDNGNGNAYSYFEDTFEEMPNLIEIASKLDKEAKKGIEPLINEKG